MKSKFINGILKEIKRRLDDIDFDDMPEIIENSYTLPCGTKVREVINTQTGMVDRYIHPIKPVEYINIDVVITRDGCVMKDIK